MCKQTLISYSVRLLEKRTWTKPYQPDQVADHTDEETRQGFVAGGRQIWAQIHLQQIGFQPCRAEKEFHVPACAWLAHGLMNGANDAPFLVMRNAPIQLGSITSSVADNG